MFTYIIMWICTSFHRYTQPLSISQYIYINHRFFFYFIRVIYYWAIYMCSYTRYCIRSRVLFCWIKKPPFSTASETLNENVCIFCSREYYVCTLVQYPCILKLYRPCVYRYRIFLFIEHHLHGFVRVTYKPFVWKYSATWMVTCKLPTGILSFFLLFSSFYTFLFE